jgi:integrase
MRIADRLNLPGATCPKSWRHTFATLLQDANVDPLIRQLTLGHAFTSGGIGALGMTSIYTHTRPETQQREIERALRLWPESLDCAHGWVLPTGATPVLGGVPQ